MVKKFVEAWTKNEKKIEEYIKTHKQSEYSTYEDLVKLVFDLVINPEMDNGCGLLFDTKHITVIDDGDYQGSLLFILHRGIYQPDPSDYVGTYVWYGSCSGCDTLQGISDYEYDIPNEQQVKDYMALCLHILQRCKYLFIDDEEKE